MQENSNHDLFKKMHENLKILIKTPKLYLDENLIYSFVNDFKTLLYDIIHKQLAPHKELGDNEEMIRYYCKYIAKNLLPIANKKIVAMQNEIKSESDLVEFAKQMLEKWVLLEDDLYALVSFRSLKHFAFYIDRQKLERKKVWIKTMPIFESYFYYANKMVLDGEMNLIRASYFPGAGKTYAGNLTCAFWFGYDKEMTILRITYSEDLVKSFTKQIESIMTSDQFKKVFPEFDKPINDVFKTHNSTELWISGASNANFYATTRDGQSTGKRAKLIMIDDITKGAKEAYNVDVQKQIVVMYDNDWSSRGDDDDQKIIALGTMWSRFDLLNVIQQRDEEDGQLVDDKLFKYTKLSVNGKGAYIGVPLLDYDTDETTCPLRYSTEYGRKKREKSADKSLFNAVYQQRPEEPEELIFAYRKLNVYTEKTFPKEILEGNYECRAFIDTNRTGFDYFVCAFYKRYEIQSGVFSKWYFTDVICRRQTFKQLKEDLFAKIIKHNVCKLGIEINTSNELPELIEEKLGEKGYNDIAISEVFSVERKEVKIATVQQEAIDEIIYPDKNMFADTSEMGIAMTMLTTYSIDKKNEHDDFPDCNAMFVKQAITDDSMNEFTILDSNCRL